MAEGANVRQDFAYLVVVGGGRWARVVAGVLLDVRPDIQLRVHSHSNARGMTEWARTRAPGRIEVREGLPDYLGSDRPTAVIVCNASRDHVPAASAALRAGIPTLVEKPVATSASVARELVALARQQGAQLAVSRVPLFARYLEAFAQHAARCPPVLWGRIIWADPRAESRYGEPKRYDPSVPVMIDTLPHVLPILRLPGGPAVSCRRIAIECGGMRTNMEITCGSVPWSVVLERNSATRQRAVHLQASNGPLRLDFSMEPGRIAVDGREINGDPEWDSAPRPLARMLQTFLDGAASGVVDTRLDPESAVEECTIMDEAVQLYRAQQVEWLSARLGGPIDEGIRYALSEMVCAGARRPAPGEALLAQIWPEMVRTGARAAAETLWNPAQGDERIRDLLRHSAGFATARGRADRGPA
jgi:predicted dehydrogenase